MSTGAGASYSVFVVELDDIAWPQRRPDRPNLYVGITVCDVAEKYAHLCSAKGPRIVQDHRVQLRTDLTQDYPRTDELSAKRQKTELMAKLRRCGCTVNGDHRVWHVYVIEIDDHLGERRDPSRPWVYVGETTLDPVDRYEQHRSGACNAKGPLYSKAVYRHDVGLRPDLYEGEPVLYTAEDAKVAERLLADGLRAESFSVCGGH